MCVISDDVTPGLLANVLPLFWIELLDRCVGRRVIIWMLTRSEHFSPVVLRAVGG
jgi:hypothetical protein